MSNNEIIKGAGFHHIALHVKDFEKSVEFYTKVLGFTKYLTWGEDDKRAAMLDMGDGSIIEMFAGGGDEPANGKFFHLAIRVDDTDAAFAAAIAGGATVDQLPKSVTIKGSSELPVRIAFIFAPGGENIEFFQIVR